MENEDIVLLISDDGVGISPEILSTILFRKREKASPAAQIIAVYNTHRRLQILYGNNYGLTYSSKPGEGQRLRSASLHIAKVTYVPQNLYSEMRYDTI
mgnify:CR=1 FL=1